MLTIDLEYGYNNAAKSGRVLPVTVWIDNPEEQDFSGTLEILTRESDGQVYACTYEVSAEAGEVSSFPCAVPLGRGADSLLIRAVYEDGSTAAEKSVPLTTGDGTPELFIGLLTDNPDALWYFDGVAVNYGQMKTRTAVLYPESFPTDRQSLDMLDVIIASSFRMSSLSGEQTRALMQWMQNGGVLVLGTGERVNDTMGPFAPEFLDDMYGEGERLELALQGVQEAPGGREVSLYVTDLSLHGGSTVLASDGTILISTANKGSGVLAAASFDFTELSEYAESHSGFADLCLVRILGDARLEKLASEAYGTGREEYWTAKALTEGGIPAAAADAVFMGTAFLGWFLLVGPVLYLLLKSRRKTMLYRKAAAVLSLLAAGIVLFAGSGIRIRDVFYSYAEIRDSREDSVSETVYLNLRTPKNGAFRVTIPEEYAVSPLTGALSREGPSPVEGGEQADRALERKTGQASIFVRDAGAFSSQLFRLERNRMNTEDGGFSGSLRVFGDSVSGTVTNRFSFPVYNAAVVLYGKVIPLGTLEAGESTDLGGDTLYHAPLNDPATVASFLCGVFDGSADREQQFLSEAEAGFLADYLSRITAGYTADARVVAFAEDISGGGRDDLVLDPVLGSGLILLTSPIAVDSREDGKISMTALQRTPEILSGDYLPATNSFYRGEPVVLGYLPGTGVRIDRIRFELPDAVFDAAGNGSGMRVFRGTISVYNYGTGNFDDLAPGQLELEGETLRHYLSPDNMITVRYADSGEQRSDGALDTALPMVTVIGEER